MSAFKRLLGIIIITLVISAIFFLYNLSENGNKNTSVMNIVTEQKSVAGSIPQSGDRVKIYVVGKDSKLRQNVARIFGVMHLSYYKREKLTQDDIKGLKKNDTIVFCQDVIANCVDLRALGEFIQNGGKVILADGLPEGYDDAYLQPFLGIVEKNIKQEYHSFYITPGFLPYGSGVVNYGGFNASTWIKVREEATVYMAENEKKVPIVYSFPYKNGKTVVINGTMLEDMNSAGILAGAMSALNDDFIYPVMGVSCIFLDNFPAVTYVDDSITMALYGRTTESFVRDEVWPVFEGIAARNQIKYIAGILSARNGSESFPDVNDSMLYTLGKSVIKFNGEVINTGYFGESGKIHFNEEYLERFKETFPNYKIHGFAITEGELKEQERIDIMKTCGDLTVFRENIDENGKGLFSKRENYNLFSLLSSGTDLNNGTLFNIINGVGAYGTISHSFDINTFIVKDKDSLGWDENSKRLETFEGDIITKLKWLSNCTLSEAQNKLDSYLDMECYWKEESNHITLWCSSFIDGQNFFLRTESEISKVNGADYEKVNDNYYLLRVHKPEVDIELVKGR